MAVKKFAEDSALREQRLAVVDDYLRRGWTVYAIARAFVENGPLAPLVAHVLSNKTELTTQQQISLVQYRCVLKDIRTLQQRFRRVVSTSTSENALDEYLNRLDFIYEQVIRDHTDAYDFADKVKALKLAVDVSRAKAIALGVDLEPEVQQRSPGSLINIETLGQLALLAAAPKPLAEGTDGRVVEGEAVPLTEDGPSGPSEEPE